MFAARIAKPRQQVAQSSQPRIIRHRNLQTQLRGCWWSVGNADKIPPTPELARGVACGVVRSNHPIEIGFRFNQYFKKYFEKSGNECSCCDTCNRFPDVGPESPSPAMARCQTESVQPGSFDSADSLWAKIEYSRRHIHYGFFATDVLSGKNGHGHRNSLRPKNSMHLRFN